MRTGVKLATILAGRSNDLVSLFANGENGFIFDNLSDLTRLFTTSVGVTQIAANDDPVGLWLDRSKWGGKSFAQLIASQPEKVSNPGPGFAATTGWTPFNGGSLSVVNGELVLTGNGVNNFAGASVSITGLEVGQTYRIAATGRRGTSNSNIGVRMNSTPSQFVLNSASISDVSGETEFVATGTSDSLILIVNGSPATGSVILKSVTVKHVSGNHNVSAAGLSSQRPWWKIGPKPYLAPDGLDDYLASLFIPTSALSMAIACRFPATDGTSRIIMGGGISATGKRAFIGKIATTGQIGIGWGNETLGSFAFGPDLGATDHVIIVTGDGVSRDVWLDGVLIDSRAPSGGPDGTGGGIALGGYNNNGVLGSFSGGRIYGALAMNRRATAAEIARMTSQLQGTFQ